MIEFKDATKVYGSGEKEVMAIDNINLHVEKGQICVFLGPSGCGKTTLLRMVNRLISITSGIIEVDGRDINSLNAIELRRSIGYVIQQNGLFPNMTIEENIYVVPKLLGWDKVKMKKRYNELMDMMGLNPDEFRKRFPWELSGGQQQRIGVARALAADPPVMLMDEPFGALDPIIREHIQNEFLRIQQDVKKTILFVSHDIDEAIKLGDTIAIFKSGHLMQQGTPDEILSRPQNEFVHDFVGSDRSLMRLTLLTVKDLVKAKKQSDRNSTKINEKTTSHKYVVQLSTNLKTALSNILSSPTGEVLVMDERGHGIGVLTINDFESLAEVRPTSLNSMAAQ
jgi:osmoprotectant transport system ATP-binding protein